MSQREDEAVALFGQAIALVTTHPKDVEGAVRQYAAGCELLGWRDEADAAWREIEGCNEATVTERRQAWALKRWLPDFQLSTYQRVEAAATHTVSGGLPADERIDWKVFVPLAQIIREAASATGAEAILTPEPKRTINDGRRTYEFVQVYHVPAQAMQAIVDKIERWVFRKAVAARALSSMVPRSNVNGADSVPLWMNR